MIRSFRSKALKRFAEKGDASKLPVKQADRVRRLLVFLDAAKHARDLDKPGLFFTRCNPRVAIRYASPGTTG